MLTNGSSIQNKRPSESAASTKLKQTNRFFRNIIPAKMGRPPALYLKRPSETAAQEKTHAAPSPDPAFRCPPHRRCRRQPAHGNPRRARVRRPAAPAVRRSAHACQPAAQNRGRAGGLCGSGADWRNARRGRGCRQRAGQGGRGGGLCGGVRALRAGADGRRRRRRRRRIRQTAESGGRRRCADAAFIVRRRRFQPAAKRPVCRWRRQLPHSGTRGADRAAKRLLPRRVPLAWRPERRLFLYRRFNARRTARPVAEPFPRRRGQPCAGCSIPARAECRFLQHAAARGAGQTGHSPRRAKPVGTGNRAAARIVRTLRRIADTHARRVARRRARRLPAAPAPRRRRAHPRQRRNGLAGRYGACRRCAAACPACLRPPRQPSGNPRPGRRRAGQARLPRPAGVGRRTPRRRAAARPAAKTERNAALSGRRQRGGRAFRRPFNLRHTRTGAAYAGGAKRVAAHPQGAANRRQTAAADTVAARPAPGRAAAR